METSNDLASFFGTAGGDAASAIGGIVLGVASAVGGVNAATGGGTGGSAPVTTVGTVDVPGVGGLPMWLVILIVGAGVYILTK